jgi:hypothetical protein
MTELLRQDQAQTKEDSVAAPLSAPVSPPVAPAKIDKSQLAIAQPKRLRDKAPPKVRGFATVFGLRAATD